VAVSGVALLLSGTPRPVHAGTWTGGASEWTQISNNIQLIEHTINLIQMVVRIGKQLKWMEKQAEKLASLDDFMNLVGSVGGLLGQVRGVLFASESLVKRWEDTHQGSRDLYQYYDSPSSAYRAIDESTRQAVVRNLKVLDIQVNSADGWPKDQQILNDLRDSIHNTDGQLKALQALGDLLVEVIRQLHLLRGVQVAHAEMMGYAVSGETQRRQFEDKVVRERFGGYTGQFAGGTMLDPATAGMGYGGSGAGLGAAAAAAGAVGAVSGVVSGDEGTPGANGVLAPAPGTVGGGVGTPGANGVLAPAPGTVGGGVGTPGANGVLAPAPGTVGGGVGTPGANGVLAPAPARGGRARARVLSPWSAGGGSDVVNPWN
jgi:P-type conjugative transfer protein TrbJ